MNKKQWLVLIVGVIALGLIFFLTPRYKITQIDQDNYIRTEQSSALYERSSGTVKLHWEHIALYAAITVLACGILLVSLRRKNG
ncbi:MAG: hypothetical protein WC732_03740 [Candidatus Omnitrophota bacterium]